VFYAAPKGTRSKKKEKGYERTPDLNRNGKIISRGTTPLLVKENREIGMVKKEAARWKRGVKGGLKKKGVTGKKGAGGGRKKRLQKRDDTGVCPHS